MDVIDEASRQWTDHGWVDAAPGMETVMALVRAHQIVVARAERKLRPMGLSLARFEILRLLAFTQRGSLSITRISQLLQVHATSITSSVDRLEAQGMVVRARGGQDRRRVYVTITPRARDLVDRATTELNDAVFTDIGLTDRQQSRLWATLKAFRANAGDFAPTRHSADGA